ncbi:MAG TPA: hypothetical protein VF981_11105 [Gemmatimonadaceae bacterium]
MAIAYVDTSCIVATAFGEKDAAAIARRLSRFWHLATALYVMPDPSQLAFVTLDATQRKVARALGFKT